MERWRMHSRRVVDAGTTDSHRRSRTTGARKKAAVPKWFSIDGRSEAMARNRFVQSFHRRISVAHAKPPPVRSARSQARTSSWFVALTETRVSKAIVVIAWSAH